MTGRGCAYRGVPGPPAPGLLEDQLTRRSCNPMADVRGRERKGAKAERVERAGGGQRAIEVSRSRPDTSPGMLGGDCAGNIERAGEGRGAEKRIPQSPLWAPFFLPRESGGERSLGK